MNGSYVYMYNLCHQQPEYRSHLSKTTIDNKTTCNKLTNCIRITLQNIINYYYTYNNNNIYPSKVRNCAVKYTNNQTKHKKTTKNHEKINRIAKSTQMLQTRITIY